MREEESRGDSNILEASSADRLGRRIRELRTGQGLSLDDLAERSQVSRSMLSKIERGENNPTLVIAVKIAAGLGLTMSQMIGVEEQQLVIKISKDNRTTFRDEKTGFVRQIFPAFEGKNIELMRCIIPPGVSSGMLEAHPPGSEKYLVMEHGKVRVMVGNQEFLLEEGDVFYFRSDVRHRFDNTGPDECSYLLIKNARTTG